MAIHMDNLRMSFFDVPKCASTTLRRFFFEVENGFVFRSFKVNRKSYGLNTLYGNPPFDEAKTTVGPGWHKATLVRGPLERVVSCYRNRVVAHGVLSRTPVETLAKEGLPTTPTLSEFVANLAAYQRVNLPVKHHTRPLSYFLGRNRGFFDKVYTLKGLNDLRADVAQRSGAEVPALQHAQNDGPKIKVDALSQDETRALQKTYAEDYEIFGRDLETNS